MWRTTTAILVLAVFILVGVGARAIVDDTPLPLASTEGVIEEFFDPGDPSLRSFSAVLQDPDARARLDRLSERYELFRAGVVRPEVPLEGFCPDAPDGQSFAASRVQVFDFAQPGTPAGARLRAVFGTCKDDSGAFHVTHIATRPIADPARRTSLARRPLLSTSDELAVLAAFVADSRTSAQFQEILVKMNVVDLTLRPLEPRDSVDDIGRFEVLAWTSAAPVAVDDYGSREALLGAHEFRISFDRSSSSIVEYEYQGL